MSLCSLVDIGPQLGTDPIEIEIKVKFKVSSQDRSRDNVEKLILKQPPGSPSSLLHRPQILPSASVAILSYIYTIPPCNNIC